VPGQVETALALSGSAAQSKIQTYPGDCDYFERVNIIAPTREEACVIVCKIMREKALSAFEGPTYRLIEVKYGSYPFDVVRGARAIGKKLPIAWKPDEIRAGQIEAHRPDGTPVVIRWRMWRVTRAGASSIGWSLILCADSSPMPATCST